MSKLWGPKVLLEIKFLALHNFISNKRTKISGLFTLNIINNNHRKDLRKVKEKENKTKRRSL